MSQVEEVKKAPTKYEVLVLPSGAEVVWRHRPGFYPEQLYDDRWLSDFGLGDYESDKRVAERWLSVFHWDELPECHREQAMAANKRDELKVRLSEVPPAEPIGWVTRLRRRLAAWLDR